MKKTMDTITNKVIIGVLTLGLVIVSVLSVLNRNTVAPVNNVPVNSTNLGANGSPNMYVPFLGINEVVSYYQSYDFNVATTTLCAVKSPSSTSTLEYFSLIVETGTSTASTIDVGSSLTNNTATSTALFIQSYAVASGARGAVILPGALPSTATSTILAPSTWVVAKTNGAGLGGYTYGGQCKYKFTLH